MRARAAPVVLAGRPPAGIEADTVLVDDFGGAHAATARLIADGHRSIGFVGNPPALFTGTERYRGYWAAHEEAGLTPREEWISRGAYDIPGAEAAAHRLLDRTDAPTALFSTNNRITLGAYRAVRGLRSGTALAAFDDFEMADLLDVPVTVVAYDADEVGRRAARLLLDRIDEKSAHATAAATQDGRPHSDRAPHGRLTSQRTAHHMHNSKPVAGERMSRRL
ncbi:substrate-binding domain-containing protein [Streptomyces sp. NPDC055059]